MRRQSLNAWTASALRRLARSERGFSVPMTLMVVVAGLGLGSAAVIASISAQRGTVRDTSATRAIAAADAGAETATYRQNKVATTNIGDCLVINAQGQLQNVSGAATLIAGRPWCPRIGPVDAGNGGTYTYQVSPWTNITVNQNGVTRVRRQLEIVAVGTSNGVSRRVAITASAKTGQGVFGDAAATGVNGVTISGNSHVGTTGNVTNAASNQNIVLSGSATLCGDALHGTESTNTISPADPSSNHVCGSTFSGPTVLPPVDPGQIATSNDDGRICVPTADPATPPRSCNLPTGTQPCSTGNVTWCAPTHTLALTGSSTLTLGGSNYYLCSLTMSGSSQLIVAQGRTVNIFFGSPEGCGISPPATQINLIGNPRLTTTSQNAGDLRLLMVGSTADPPAQTIANFGGNSRTTNEFTLYAPRTDITLGGNASYVGAAAGRTLTTSGSAQFLASNNSLNSNLNVAIQYRRDRYVECVGGTFPAGTSAQPDDSC